MKKTPGIKVSKTWFAIGTRCDLKNTVCKETGLKFVGAKNRETILKRMREIRDELPSRGLEGLRFRTEREALLRLKKLDLPEKYYEVYEGADMFF